VITIDWAGKVTDAITALEVRTRRVLEPDQALALIDDVVERKFAAGDLGAIHGIPEELVSTTLRQITKAVGTGGVRSLAAGGWWERKSLDEPFEVAPGFAEAWKKARGLP
jgi:hypothetical protein